MYRLLTLVISLIRVALRLDNNAFQSVDRASSMAADISLRRLANEQASQRQEEMSADGTVWGAWSEASISNLPSRNNWNIESLVALERKGGFTFPIWLSGRPSSSNRW